VVIARRAALAVAGGLLLYAGHPPWDIALAGPLALVPLLALGRDVAGDVRHRVRTGFGWGLLAAAIFFGPLLWFIYGIDAVAWTLLVLIESLSIAAFVAALAAWGDRPARAVVAVVWWVGLEALRSSFPFGGFSWGVLGYTQHDGGLLLPVARTLGVLGVSVACAALAVAVESALQRLRSAPRSAFRPVLAGVAVLAVCALLRAVPPPAPTGETIDIAGVQAANIQYTSAAWAGRQDSDRIVRVAEEVLAATRPLADDPPDVTVWPENSLDADVTDERNTGVRTAVAEGLDLLDGNALLAGTFMAGPRPGTHYNALVELTPDGIGDVYRKRRPVPFAEYIPGRQLFDWYPALDQVSSDMQPGDGPDVLEVAGARIGAVICFENTFPALAREQVLSGANVLVVSTNNSSWGRSTASEAHVAFSQLRAVETGRYILHAGISGISGLIDPTGHVTQRTDHFAQALTRADLPLVDNVTPAMRLSHLVGPTAMVLSALAVAWLLLTRRKPH
jgi:apolipoprotein N-acyltransferase